MILHDVRWSEDLSVSGRVSWPGRSGKVVGELKLAGADRDERPTPRKLDRRRGAGARTTARQARQRSAGRRDARAMRRRCRSRTHEQQRWVCAYEKPRRPHVFWRARDARSRFPHCLWRGRVAALQERLSVAATPLRRATRSPSSMVRAVPRCRRQSLRPSQIAIATAMSIRTATFRHPPNWTSATSSARAAIADFLGASGPERISIGQNMTSLAFCAVARARAHDQNRRRGSDHAIGP